MEFVNTRNREYRIRLNEAGEVRIDHENNQDMGVAAYCEYAGVPWEAPYLESMESEIRDAIQEGENVLQIDLDDIAGIPISGEAARALWAYLGEQGEQNDVPDWLVVRGEGSYEGDGHQFLSIDEEWTEDPSRVAVYLDRYALPEKIESILGAYTLSLEGDYYAPPEDYWPEHERGHATGDAPAEWLADEYDCPLYGVVEIDDIDLMREYIAPVGEEGDEEIDYSSLSRDEQEQMAMGLETSLEVMDALQAIAGEDGVSVMQVWQDGYTPARGADAVLEAVRDHIRETIPEDEQEEKYYWGVEGAFPLEPEEFPDSDYIEE